MVVLGGLHWGTKAAGSHNDRWGGCSVMRNANVKIWHLLSWGHSRKRKWLGSLVCVCGSQSEDQQKSVASDAWKMSAVCAARGKCRRRHVAQPVSLWSTSHHNHVWQGSVSTRYTGLYTCLSTIHTLMSISNSWLVNDEVHRVFLLTFYFPWANIDTKYFRYL